MGRSGRFWRNSSRQNSVHVGVGAVSHRQRLERGIGAVHHFGSVRGHGSIGYALIYPIAVPAVCFVLVLFLMPETRKISIWEPIEPRTAW
jgi:hypothetical protein